MDSDIALPSGRIRARRWGAPAAPLLLCVPGLSANLCGYTRIAEQLASDERHIVAIDLRGAGRSEVTQPGSYGMESHARDVVGVADALDAERFDLVGWSLGALIAMSVAVQAGGRLRSVTLIDHAGPTEAAALIPVREGLARLDMSASSPGDYVSAVRAAGHVDPWSPFWDAYYTYELEQRSDGRVASGSLPRRRRRRPPPAVAQGLEPLLARPDDADDTGACAAATQRRAGGSAASGRGDARSQT